MPGNGGELDMTALCRSMRFWPAGADIGKVWIWPPGAEWPFFEVAIPLYFFEHDVFGKPVRADAPALPIRALAGDHA